MMKNNQTLKLLLLLAAWPFFANAQEIPMNTAQMQAMDKITGKVNIIEVPVNGEIKFGSFSVVVRACKSSPEGEIPENYAFVDVTDKSFDQTEYNIFKGWMISSSPAVHAVEHPIYDVWLLRCVNRALEDRPLLSAEQLAARDQLPRLFDLKQETQTLQTNTFNVQEKAHIQFKDSMYREEAPKVQKPAQEEVKRPGGPENLLNIKESYEDEDEEAITIPADELSAAIAREAAEMNKASTENESENKEVAPLEVGVDQDLTSAIDQELANQSSGD